MRTAAEVMVTACAVQEAEDFVAECAYRSAHGVDRNATASRLEANAATMDEIVRTTGTRIKAGSVPVSSEAEKLAGQKSDILCDKISLLLVFCNINS